MRADAIHFGLDPVLHLLIETVRGLIPGIECGTNAYRHQAGMLEERVARPKLPGIVRDGHGGDRQLHREPCTARMIGAARSRRHTRSFRKDHDRESLLDPVATLLLHAHPGNVDTVIVAGRVLKRDGRLLTDLERAKRELIASHEHINAAIARIDMTLPDGYQAN